MQRCSGGNWSACMDEVTASVETCDLEDDDCDGDIDEDATCTTTGLDHALTAACQNGTCVPAQCQALWGDCNDSRSDGCETTLTTLDDCAACDQPCAIEHAAATCAGGSCHVASCEHGYADCDFNGSSCETPLDSVDACGACNTPCNLANAVPACVAAGASWSCEIASCTSSRYVDCDLADATGCEVDVETDPAHCGSCNYSCLGRDHVAAATCAAQSCVFDCAPGYLDCDGEADNGCEHDSAQGLCPRCFAEATSNFSGSAYSYSAAVDFACGGTHTFDSGTLSWDTACCGTCPEVSGPVTQTDASGAQVVILRAATLNVASGTTVRLVGPYPVIIAVHGDATVAGTIDASASGALPGAGGNWSCGSSAGSAGTGSSSTGGGGGGAILRAAARPAAAAAAAAHSGRMAAAVVPAGSPPAAQPACPAAHPNSCRWSAAATAASAAAAPPCRSAPVAARCSCRSAESSRRPAPSVPTAGSARSAVAMKAAARAAARAARSCSRPACSTWRPRPPAPPAATAEAVPAARPARSARLARRLRVRKVAARSMAARAAAADTAACRSARAWHRDARVGSCPRRPASRTLVIDPRIPPQVEARTVPAL
jgi:hypothetical protein